jgi:hypothetical protein
VIFGWGLPTALVSSIIMVGALRFIARLRGSAASASAHAVLRLAARAFSMRSKPAHSAVTVEEAGTCDERFALIRTVRPS